MTNMTRILLVEDDPMIAEIYQKKFLSSGFEVDVAATATEVFQKVQEKGYDLMLLDLVLPEMNGIEILRKLKNDTQLRDPNLKVLIFSNLNDQENQEKALELGAIGFIEKSMYNPAELVEEVQRILHESSEREKNAERRMETSFGEQRSEASLKKRILFIEDEEVFREMFGGKLRDEGYEVDVVSNGMAGAQMALEGNYDLVITDMMIPGLRGDEVVQQIRATERVKDVPILVISASATDDEIEHVKSLGIQEFYLKTSITPTILFEKVQGVFAEGDHTGGSTE